MNKYIEFSRVNPPRTLVPVNNNAVGSHNELLPNTEYKPEPPKLIKRVKKALFDNDKQLMMIRIKQEKHHYISHI